MTSSSPSLLVRRDGGGFEFYSPQSLRSFLRISPPYNTCIAHAPYARNAPHCSRPINYDRKQEVPGQFERLYQAPVPSRRAAHILENLSSNVVCGITGWHQNKASQVYQEWCDHLWDAYLHANHLDAKLWIGGTPPLSRASWEAALEDAREEQRDDSSSEEYDSDEDDNAYDSDLISRETTPDTTISSFDESPFHLNGPGRSQSSQASHSSGHSEIPPPPVETSSTPEETVVEESVISGESDVESLVGVPTEDEDSDTSEDTDAETESQNGSEDDETGVASQDGNEDEQPRVRANGLGIIDTRDTNSSQDHVDERSASFSSHRSGAAATERDGDAHGDDVTGLVALGSSFFDDAEEVVEAVTVPSALIPSRPGFRRYPQAPTALSQLKQLWNTMTQTVSPNRRHSGFIYAFARRSLPGFLKIGYVNTAAIQQPLDSDPVDNRLAKWQADCGHPIAEVFRVAIACRAVERIESLVHLTLRELRWVEDPPCSRCERRWRSRRGRGGGRHDEWFEVEEQTARCVVNLWAAFAANLPYDQWGRMVDFWSEKVDEQRRLIREGDTAMNWVNRMPRLLQELTRRRFDSISPFR